MQYIECLLAPHNTALCSTICLCIILRVVECLLTIECTIIANVDTYHFQELCLSVDLSTWIRTLSPTLVTINVIDKSPVSQMAVRIKKYTFDITALNIFVLAVEVCKSVQDENN